MFCPEMEFVGRVAVRTGYCRTRDFRFSFLPDFLIRYRRVSQVSLESFGSIFKRLRRLKESIDEWTEGLPEEFYVPLSTAHCWLSTRFAVPP
jgi:hypothetical protein